MSMTPFGPEDLIAQGQKFALIALSVNADDDIDTGGSSDVRVLSGGRFTLPSHWREWLGSLRTEQIEECNLFMIATSTHTPADILDAENRVLFRKVWNAYIGLLITDQVAPSDAPVHLSGGRRSGEVDVQEHSNLDTPLRGFITGYPTITESVVRLALEIGTAIETLRDPEKTGRLWRLIRTLTIFKDAAAEPQILDRIHEYCRCLEGLLLPDQGDTRRQFKSRSELFIGPSHHKFIGELYDVRSAVEHLNEERYLHPFHRETMLDLVTKEAVAGFIVRRALQRLLTRSGLIDHFVNAAAVANFWRLDAEQRRELWGPPFNPMDVLRNYRPDYITNAMLGADE